VIYFFPVALEIAFSMQQDQMLAQFHRTGKNRSFCSIVTIVSV